MGWPEPGVRAESRGVLLLDVAEAQGTQRTSDPGRIVFKAESPWGSSWPSPHGAEAWPEAQGGPGLVQVPGFFPKCQMSLLGGTQPSQSLTKILRWTEVWDTPEVLGGWKSPLQIARAVHTGARPCGARAQRSKMT